MYFQKIKPVQPYTHYLDRALSQAKKRADTAKSRHYSTELMQSVMVEKERIRTVQKVLSMDLIDTLASFPEIDALPPFYLEMVKAAVDYVQLKKSFGALKWADGKITEFSRRYEQRMMRFRHPGEFTPMRREFYGRICSVMKQIRLELAFLEDARRTMHDFPNIDPRLFTVAIAGFPNVGKSTLLAKLTDSKPGINTYPFTTTSLNMGYRAFGHKKAQFIDTPGTLNRLNKMNAIEKQAFIALQHAANLIIYVFDLTEPYPLSDQLVLYQRVVKLGKRVVPYLSKTDVLDEAIVALFLKKHEAITSIEGLDAIIEKAVKG